MANALVDNSDMPEANSTPNLDTELDEMEQLVTAGAEDTLMQRVAQSGGVPDQKYSNQGVEIRARTVVCEQCKTNLNVCKCNHYDKLKEELKKASKETGKEDEKPLTISGREINLRKEFFDDPETLMSIQENSSIFTLYTELKKLNSDTNIDNIQTIGKLLGSTRRQNLRTMLVEDAPYIEIINYVISAGENEIKEYILKNGSSEDLVVNIIDNNIKEYKQPGSMSSVDSTQLPQSTGGKVQFTLPSTSHSTIKTPDNDGSSLSQPQHTIIFNIPNKNDASKSSPLNEVHNLSIPAPTMEFNKFNQMGEDIKNMKKDLSNLTTTMGTILDTIKTFSESLQTLAQHYGVMHDCQKSIERILGSQIQKLDALSQSTIKDKDVPTSSNSPSVDETIYNIDPIRELAELVFSDMTLNVPNLEIEDIFYFLYSLELSDDMMKEWTMSAGIDPTTAADVINARADILAAIKNGNIEMGAQFLRVYCGTKKRFPPHLKNIIDKHSITKTDEREKSKPMYNYIPPMTVIPQDPLVHSSIKHSDKRKPLLSDRFSQL